MKNRQLNKKGFTLVEIIVSIAIFSAVLAVLGSVMVSGFKYFYETSNTDLDKRSIDQLSSYVREQLLYATDVKIQNSKPEGKWYSISVVDNKLHHYDQDEIDLNAFNNDSYYNSHSFKMTIKAYENNRLDLSYSMLDGTEALYTTRDTLELMNVTSIENAPFADEKIVGQDDLKIYYKKDKTAINNGNVDDTPTVITGTVADQIVFLTLENNRGKLEIPDKYTEKMIYKYDMVYSDGYWWMLIIGNENIAGNEVPTSDTNKKWKRISAEWCETSGYEKGDIIIYNNGNGNKYYQCQNDIINYGNTIFYPDSNDSWVSSFWKEIDKENLPADGSSHLSNHVSSNASKYRKTIINKIQNFDLSNVKDLSQFSPEQIRKIPVVANANKPNLNEIYKITEKNLQTGSTYISYYIKVFNNNSLPGEILNGKVAWQEIRIDYVDTSAYTNDDIVYYALSRDIFIKALGNIEIYKLITAVDSDERWSVI